MPSNKHIPPHAPPTRKSGKKLPLLPHHPMHGPSLLSPEQNHQFCRLRKYFISVLFRFQGLQFTESFTQRSVITDLFSQKECWPYGDGWQRECWPCGDGWQKRWRRSRGGRLELPLSSGGAKCTLFPACKEEDKYIETPSILKKSSQASIYLRLKMCWKFGQHDESLVTPSESLFPFRLTLT